MKESNIYIYIYIYIRNESKTNYLCVFLYFTGDDV
jgi:hypothetical protein